MHFIQRDSPVIFNTECRVRLATRVTLPRGAMKRLVEDITFWPGFAFMVLGIDADIQKGVNFLVGYGQGRSEHAEKR